MSDSNQDWFYEYINVNGSDLNYSTGILGESIFKEDGVEIVDAVNIGRALYINGALQTCEKDDFIYSEMIVKPALEIKSQEDRLRVLLIGAGDGGALREILRYGNVFHVDHVEISKTVMDACQDYLKFTELEKSLEDPRVNVTYTEGAKFVKRMRGESKWDIIIVDSSDPVGVSSNLFAYEFLNNCKGCLESDGLLVFQAQSYLSNVEFVRKMIFYARDIYDHAYYYHVPIQSYPSGGIGFVICSPTYSFLGLSESSESGNFYSDEIFKASMILPPYVKISNRMDAFNRLSVVYDLENLINIKDIDVVNRYMEILGEPENFFFDNFPLCTFIVKREGNKTKYGLRLLTLLDEKRKHDLPNKAYVRNKYMHSRILRTRREYGMRIAGFEWDFDNKTCEVFLFTEDLPKVGIKEYPALYGERPKDYSNKGFISFKTKGTDLIDTSLYFINNIEVTVVSENSKTKNMKFMKNLNFNSMFTDSDAEFLNFWNQNGFKPSMIRFNNCLDYELHLKM